MAFFHPQTVTLVISREVGHLAARRRSEPTRLELRRLLVWRRAGLERLTDPGGTLGSQRYHRGIIALSTCRAHPVRRRHALMNWKLRASRAMPPQPESAIIPPPSSALQNVLPDSLQPAVLADNHAGEPDEGPSRKRSRGKPAGPQKCPTCRKKSRPCGTECPDWPGHLSNVAPAAPSTAGGASGSGSASAFGTDGIDAQSPLPAGYVQAQSGSGAGEATPADVPGSCTSQVIPRWPVDGRLSPANQASGAQARSRR